MTQMKTTNSEWVSGQDVEFLAQSLTRLEITRKTLGIYGGERRFPEVWVQNGQLSAKYILAEIPFIRRGDSAYVIVEGPTWEEAEANAVALGGHLVTINDAEENEWF